MAMIPPSFLDCVVAIGVDKNWIGTGFLVGRYFNSNEKKEKTYHVFLVTNKHVLDKFDEIKIKFNPNSLKPSKDYPLKLKNEKNELLWTGHPNPKIDVAIININPNVLITEDMRFSYFRNDEHIFNKKNMLEIGTTEGDEIYSMGFPMGLVNPDKQYVIVRGGCIARIRDFLDSKSSEFLIDSFVFPGNSGGPVILKPEAISITGTKSNNKSALIGMIQSYIPYKDIAISNQTKQPRVIFEENTGLASVVSTDFILETMELWFTIVNTMKKKS